MLISSVQLSVFLYSSLYFSYKSYYENNTAFKLSHAGAKERHIKFFCGERVG